MFRRSSVMSQMSKCLNKSRSRVPDHEENLASPYSLGFGSSSSWTQNEKVTLISPSSALIVQSEYHNRWEPREPHRCWFILLCAKPGSVFALARRKACTRWKTGPRAGWPFAPSRPTPKATEDWRRGEAGKGYGGTWRNVLSARRRGEPARLWAGTDTGKGCKKQRHQRKRIISFYFQVWVKIKALRQFSLFWSVFCPHVWLHPPSPSSWLPDIQSIIPVVIGEAELWVQSGRGKEYWGAGAIRKGFVVVLMVTWKTEHS